MRGYNEIQMCGSFLLLSRLWGSTTPFYTIPSVRQSIMCKLLSWKVPQKLKAAGKHASVLSFFGQASYSVAVMAAEPTAKQTCWPERLSLWLLCAQIRHWSQMAAFSLCPSWIQIIPTSGTVHLLKLIRMKWEIRVFQKYFIWNTNLILEFTLSCWILGN